MVLFNRSNFFEEAFKRKAEQNINKQSFIETLQVY